MSLSKPVNVVQPPEHRFRNDPSAYLLNQRHRRTCVFSKPNPALPHATPVLPPNTSAILGIRGGGRLTRSTALPSRHSCDLEASITSSFKARGPASLEMQLQ
jgi:hypothetical protein